MAIDFTIIQAVRQRFGDGKKGSFDLPVELDAPFVGRSKDFPFSCPNVDSGKFAVLQFESIGLRGGQILQINGVDIPGGTAGGPFFVFPQSGGGTTGPFPFWKSHSLLVPEGLLRQQNVLHITAPRTDGNVDDFVVDNIIVFFKIRRLGVTGTTAELQSE